jgi:2-phospho-L-lactate guanylyltransferase
MVNIAIIPYKGGPQAKIRLSSALGTTSREQLSRGMLDHVVRQLQSTRAIDAILVVTSTAVSGVEVIPDPGEGLNAAVRAGMDTGIRKGADTILVVPADLPSLTPADICATYHALIDSVSGVVAPSKDGGTGGLLLRKSMMIEPQFGPSSARLHQHSLAATGVKPAVIHRSGLALDIDEPEDLDLFGDSLLDFVWKRNTQNVNRPVHGSDESGKNLTRPNLEE